VSSTRIGCHIKAPAQPSIVHFRALLDPLVVARWKVPTGMTCLVHEFAAREDGALRISLTYDAPTGPARRRRRPTRTTVAREARSERAGRLRGGEIVAFPENRAGSWARSGRFADDSDDSRTIVCVGGAHPCASLALTRRLSETPASAASMTRFL
jgi:hypothetical protein